MNAGIAAEQSRPEQAWVPILVVHDHGKLDGVDAETLTVEFAVLWVASPAK